MTVIGVSELSVGAELNLEEFMTELTLVANTVMKSNTYVLHLGYLKPVDQNAQKMYALVAQIEIVSHFFLKPNVEVNDAEQPIPCRPYRQ